MVHVKMVTPTLITNALILMSVNLFAPMPQITQRSAIDVRQAPFVQIMWAATNAQDHGSADRFSPIGPVWSDDSSSVLYFVPKRNFLFLEFSTGSVIFFLEQFGPTYSVRRTHLDRHSYLVRSGHPCSGCQKGWTGTGETCTDIDECEEKTHQCAYSGGLCENIDSQYKCKCDEGWVGDGVKCDDVDECATNTHDCPTGIACRNTDGSFACGSCANGFQLTAEGNCDDIDECYLGVHNCANPGGTCINNEGSFTCPGKGSALVTMGHHRDR